MAQTIHNACSPHDHGDCIHSALKQAQTICSQRGVRLTPLREQVLRLVWQSHTPVGAYDLLARLRAAGDKPAAPPTVYRALDFLQEQGLVHRIASLNAFIGCHHPGTPHPGSFLICRRCQRVFELSEQPLGKLLAQQAAGTGFTVESTRIEVLGLCRECQQQDNAHD